MLIVILRQPIKDSFHLPVQFRNILLFIITRSDYADKLHFFTSNTNVLFKTYDNSANGNNSRAPARYRTYRPPWPWKLLAPLVSAATVRAMDSGISSLATRRRVA